MLASVAGLLLGVAGLNFALADWVHIGNPACNDVELKVQCLPQNLNSAPAVGMYLAADYGTIAISFPNGTIFDVARIPAPKEFTFMFADLAQKNSCPRGESGSAPFQDELQHIKETRRRENRARGLAASVEAEMLAGMMWSLRKEAQHFLTEKITHAAVVLPPLPGLRWADVSDAADYIGLKLLYGYSNPKVSDLLTATVVGAKVGFCKNSEDYIVCDKENDVMHGKGILRLSFDGHALGLDGGFCASAADCIAWKKMTRDIHGLGWLDDIRHDSPSQYRRHVKDWIIQVTDYILAGGVHVDKIILMGQYAMEPDFIAMLEEALDESMLGPFWRKENSKDGWNTGYDTVFVAARGIAEIARRIQTGQQKYGNEPECWSKDKSRGGSRRLDGVIGQYTF